MKKWHRTEISLLAQTSDYFAYRCYMVFKKRNEPILTKDQWDLTFTIDEKIKMSDDGRYYLIVRPAWFDEKAKENKND